MDSEDKKTAQSNSVDPKFQGQYVPVPEDFEPSPKKEKGPLNRIPGSEYAKPAIILYVIFGLVSFIYWMEPFGQNFWVSNESIFHDHEYWRLVTALFTHADMIHLLANGPLFLVFGWTLRAFFGVMIFPILPLFIGVFSNLLTIYFYPPSVKLVGASGMVYGMVALWLSLYIKFDKDYTLFMRIFRATGFSLIVMFPTTLEKSTSYLAHFFGFSLGAAVGVILGFFVSVHEIRDGEQAHP